MKRRCNMKRRYKHDCYDCVFLGQHQDADLYVCIKDEDGVTMDTVIARFSSDPPDYLSGLIFAYDYGSDLSIDGGDMRFVFEAFKRAISKGFRP
jgi:predicted 2-oxoglutarate/Fe(II)-dependent dioxygenase YbiX